MRRKQAGVSPVSVLVVGGIGAFLFIVGMQAVPAWNEFFSVKRVLNDIATNANPQSATVAELRKQFELKSSVDDIKTVKPGDLEFSKQGGRIVIAVNYERRVPLAGNASLVFDFRVNTAEE